MAAITDLATLAHTDLAASDWLVVHDLSAATDKKMAPFVSGTWTPALAFGGSSTGITYDTQVGRYARIGNIAIAAFDIVLTNKGSFGASDAATITGLPYSSAYSVLYGGHAHYVSSITGLTNPPFGYISSMTIALLYYSTALAALTYSQFANTSRLTMTLTYRAV